MTLLFWPLTDLNSSCEGLDLQFILTTEEQFELEKLHRETPFPSGNHWLAIKGRHQINVVEMVHLGNARLDPVFKGLAPILAAADQIFLK